MLVGRPCSSDHDSLGVLETVGAAVRCINAFETELLTSLARRFAVTLDLPSLTLVAGSGMLAASYSGMIARLRTTHHA